MKKTLILLMAAVLALAFLTSCKKNDSVNNNNNDGPATVGIYINNIATPFVELDSAGNTFDLESLRGKVILVNFSAMWCGPCRNEASMLGSLYSKYKDQGLEIIQCIYQDEDGNPSDASDLHRWIQEFGCLYPVITDPDRSSVNIYNFSGIPFNLIIDRDFIIRGRMEGYDHDGVISKIEKYL